jgi:hypothetical protein
MNPPKKLKSTQIYSFRLGNQAARYETAAIFANDFGRRRDLLIEKDVKVWQSWSRDCPNETNAISAWTATPI